MAYYYYDVNGQFAEAATIRGWKNYRTFLRDYPLVADFLRTGFTITPKILAKNLSEIEPPDDLLEVHQRLIDAANKAEDILILSDGLVVTGEAV